MTRGLRNAALGLAFTGQLVALLHMGLVHHGVCAEHGELVEVVKEASKAPDGHHATGVSSAAVSIDDGDEHCGASTMTRSAGAVSPPVFTHGAVVVAGADACVSSRSAPSFTRDFLDVAPKHGPPSLDV